MIGYGDQIASGAFNNDMNDQRMQEESSDEE
jgi:hypothetical protein